MACAPSPRDPDTKPWSILLLGWGISSILDVIGAFLRREGVEDLADALGCALDAALGSLSQDRLEHGEDLLDRIENGGCLGDKLAPLHLNECLKCRNSQRNGQPGRPFFKDQWERRGEERRFGQWESGQKEGRGQPQLDAGARA